jgi:hypothetical protein
MADLRHKALILAVACAGLGTPCLASAKDGAPDDWATQKCSLYADAWQWVVDTRDLRGVGAGFMATHQAFVDSGCNAALTTCPQTKAEIALADLLTVLSMNEGMASTFAPFACP